MKKLSDFIFSLGIDRFGFCKAGDFYAVVMLFPYYSGKQKNSNISIYTYSEDYHIVIKKYLEKVAGFIKSLGRFETEIYVDVSPYNDIMLAKSAGLGVIGKNGLLINDKYGSLHFIGYVITDMPLEISEVYNSECLNCNKCVKACPSGALEQNDFLKCLSSITQKKGELLPSEQELIKQNGSVFGCDICQMVCPMNDFKITPLEEFKSNLLTSIKKSDLEGLSNREFKQKYGNRAFSWRGKNILIRNLDIIGNQPFLKDDVPDGRI